MPRILRTPFYFVCVFFALSFGTSLECCVRASFGAVPSESNISATKGASSGVFRPGLIRVDVSIATSERASWDGAFSLSRGSFEDLTPLGVGATSATDFFFDGAERNRVSLRARSATTFCGVEATIFAPRDSRLEFNLRNLTSGKSYSKSVFVERLIDSSTFIPFDDKGNGVKIVRAPADEIPIQLEKIIVESSSEQNGERRARVAKASLFRPGENVRLLALPRSSATKTNDPTALSVVAKSLASGETLLQETREISSEETRQIDAAVENPAALVKPFEFTFAAPSTPGVVEITLELSVKKNASLRTTFAAPGVKKPSSTVIARRVVQFVVAPTSLARVDSSQNDENDETNSGDLRAELLESIDPTNPNWRKAFMKKSILPFYKGKTSFWNENKSGGVQTTFAAPNESWNQESEEKNEGEVYATFSVVFDTEELENRRVAGQAPEGNNKKLFSLAPSKIGIFGNPKDAQNADSLLTLYRDWEQKRFQRMLDFSETQNWGLIGALWEKPMSSGASRPFDAAERAQYSSGASNYLRLEPNKVVGARLTSGVEGNGVNALTSGVSWEAYPVPIREIGKPHLLEIEYPANFPQQMGVSILEPSVWGGLFPTSQDYGLVVQEETFENRSSNESGRFRVVFWPRTQAPIILLSNCSSKTAAAYGQIRVYCVADSESADSGLSRGRSVGLTLTRSALCKQFSVPLARSVFGANGSEDWNSFNEAISRELYYLSVANYDSAMVAVLSEGASIYPSRFVGSSPRYDGGVFLSSGGDPVKKDVLTLAISKFEEKNKRFIPLIDLDSTVPILEERLRQIRAKTVASDADASLEGIEWIGADGVRLINTRQNEDGAGPYYNILHPQVEEVALGIIDEIVARCRSYACFSGLALDVGAQGWLALPDDPFVGMDDATIARFVRETNLQAVLSTRGDLRVQDLLLVKGDERYRFRAKFISDNCLQEWLNWRCDALYRFYKKVRARIAEARPDVRLYLVATRALDGPNSRAVLYPALTERSRLADALKLVGFDLERYNPYVQKKRQSVSQVDYSTNNSSNVEYDPYITLLRPEIVASTSTLAERVLTDEFATIGASKLFCGSQIYPGACFFHRPTTRTLYEFSQISPFKPTIAELTTRALPAGYENRRRFARALATEDALCFYDGGDLAPMGQEDALYDWIGAFKRLPAATFKTWEPSQDAARNANNDADEKEATERENVKSLQPLVVRYYRNETETWVYFVNVAPFHLGVKTRLKTERGGNYKVYPQLRGEAPVVTSDSFNWTFTAAPYDLIVLKIADPQAAVESVDVSRPSETCGKGGRLEEAVQNFVDRVLVARSGVEHYVRNGDFEESNASLDVESQGNEFDDGVGSDVAGEKSLEKTNLLGLEMPKMNLFKKAPRSNDEPRENFAVDKTHIPGWRAFGPNDVEAELDFNATQGACLRVSSQGSVGGVVCQPFETPTTGRLCVQIQFGVPRDVSALPLNVCLTGRLNGAAYNRRVAVGQTIIERARKLQANSSDELIWVQDVALFNRLPLEGLEDLSLRFEICGKGTVWIDNIKLYKLAFANEEQNELMRSINTAEYRVSQDRVNDVLFMLDGYWAKLLKEQIPDDSPLLAALPDKPTKNESEPKNEDAKEQEEKGFITRTLDKMKFWK